MMKIHRLAGLILIFMPLLGFSQEIQWAAKVLGVSSERTNIKTGDAYKANQALGKPNYVLQKKEGLCAWTPSVSDFASEEWIKVGFSNPQKAKQLLIAENFNAGCIIKILAYDKADKESIIFERKADAPKDPTDARLWQIAIRDSTITEVAAVKLVMNPALSNGWNQIDAIGLSNAPQAVELDLNVVKINKAQDENPKENIGKAVNTKLQELAPVITKDGRTLYFTRGRLNSGEERGKKEEINQDVWFSQLESDGIWSEAQNLGEPVNDKNNNGLLSVSSDGKKIFLTHVFVPDASNPQPLATSYRSRAGWQKPKGVIIEKYKDYGGFAEFSIAANNKALISAFIGANTVGEKDLYVSFKKGEDIWTTPLNIGTTINTPAEESSPFIAADNKTLYFTSKGHAGYGSGDIFMSKRLDSSWTKWSEPVNIGKPINSEDWDGYLSIPASGEYAYFSSNENAIGESDIFRIKLFPAIKPEPVAMISGIVSNLFDKKPIAADIQIETMGDSTREIHTVEYNPETGEYKAILPVKKTYSLIAQKKGFLSISETIDLSKDNRYREIKKNIYLAPIQAGQKIVLNNVNFEQSKFDVLPQAFPELNRIVDLMKEYETVEILLEGHTDNQGDVVLNVKLSESRVEEVKKYLIQKGISEKRIQTKAWGGSKPFTSNVTEESRKKNRRVEFSIVKM